MKATIKKEVEKAIKDISKAKAMEKEAKALKKRASGILLPLMAAHGIEKYALEGVGTASVRVSRGRSINVDKLKEQLLIAGHSVEEVQRIIDASSSSWETEYVEVR